MLKRMENLQLNRRTTWNKILQSIYLQLKCKSETEKKGKGKPLNAGNERKKIVTQIPVGSKFLLSTIFEFCLQKINQF